MSHKTSPQDCNIFLLIRDCMSLNDVKLSMSLIGVCEGKYEVKLEQFGVKYVRFSLGGG